jgi:hypothetical protein
MFMKKPSVWAGIIGGILVLIYIFGGITNLANPTDLVLVNVAIAVGDLLFIALGAFLVYCSFKWRQEEEAHPTPVHAPDSKEDIEKLRTRRNWILAFVLLIPMIGSTEGWILNDYTAGLTLLNILIIFDLLFNLLFLYIAISLMRGKADALKLLLWAIIPYGLGLAVLYGLRGYWFGPIIHLLIIAYFIFAIKAPVNRRNYRLAHLIMLPILVILLIAWPQFDNLNMDELSDKQVLLEQQLTTENAQLSGNYVLFLQREAPSHADMTAVQESIVARDKRIHEVLANLDTLEAEERKQIPSVAMEKGHEHNRYFRMTLATHLEQSQKANELMEYAKTLDFQALTDAQREELRIRMKEIDDLNLRFTEIDFELENANLEV